MDQNSLSNVQQCSTHYVWIALGGKKRCKNAEAKRAIQCGEMLAEEGRSSTLRAPSDNVEYESAERWKGSEGTVKYPTVIRKADPPIPQWQCPCRIAK
uniref:Uncharacterized protein n=1 Tax=Ascaris lumbricoides TaxID=6252 RepID=A0A0M3IGB1_ASCLU